MGALEEEDEEDLLAELGLGAAMLVIPLAAVSVVFAPAVTAQTGSCDDALPPELVGNYSGLACSPVWNNFMLRYAQGGDNMLRVVLSAMYSSGWVGMSFSKDGLMVGSSAMVGWVGKTGQPTSSSSPSSPQRQGALHGRRRQGLPRLQQPRPHRPRQAGQDLPRLPAQVPIPAQAAAGALRLRLCHPCQRPPSRAPGQIGIRCAGDARIALALSLKFSAMPVGSCIRYDGDAQLRQIVRYRVCDLFRLPWYASEQGHVPRVLHHRWLQSTHCARADPRVRPGRLLQHQIRVRHQDALSQASDKCINLLDYV